LYTTSSISAFFTNTPPNRYGRYGLATSNHISIPLALSLAE